MATLAKLTAYLNVNSAQFESGMKRARLGLTKFGDVAKKSATIAAGAMTVAGTAAALLATRQAAVIDQTAKTATKLGVLIGDLQAYRLVAQESGVATNTFDMALQRQTRRVAEAAQGMGEAQGALKQLNLDAKALAQLSPDKQFLEIATALEGVSSQSERIRLAFKLFDSEGVGVVNMLGDLSGELQKAREFNDKFNITLTQTDAAKVEEARDTFGRLGQILGGVGNTIAVYFSPLVTDLSNYLIQAGYDGEWLGKAINRGMAVAAKAIDFVRQSIIGLQYFMTSVSLFIDRMILAATDSLFNVAKAAAEFPVIGEQMRQLAISMKTLNDAAYLSGKENINNLKEQEKAAGKYKDTLDLITESQDRAEKRAQQRIASNTGGGFTLGDANAEKKAEKKAEDAAKALEKLRLEHDKERIAALKSKNALEQYGEAAKDVRGQVISLATSGLNNLENSFLAVTQGTKSFADAFTDMAASILEDIARMQIRNSITGPLSSFLNNAIGGLFGFTGGPSITRGAPTANLGAYTGAGYSYASYATGSRSIMRDQMARVHKGEMIIPASQANNGGRMPQIVINNYDAGNTAATAQASPSGDRIDVVIDKIQAGNIRRVGTQTDAALRQRNKLPLSKG
jgi:hypothetical protein